MVSLAGRAAATSRDMGIHQLISRLIAATIVTLDVTHNAVYIYPHMIGSYRDKRTRSFAGGQRVKAFDGFVRKLSMKLDQLDAATSLRDLDLPGNCLEALKSDRKGQYSVRVNDQWRICFEWPKGAEGPVNVEVVDYH